MKVSENICISCRKPKASLNCEICQESLCKACVRFLDSSTFSFLKKIPEALVHTYYCSSCFDAQVEPALASYQELMERARGLYFFFNLQRKPIHLIKKAKETIQVEACDDRNETILRLAFLAAEQGYNAVIEAEVVSKKMRNSGYQKSLWTGVGIPAQVDSERLERRTSIN